MRRIRRVTVEIEHRKLTVSDKQTVGGPEEVRAAGEAGRLQATCPVCNSQWLLFDQAAEASGEQPRPDPGVPLHTQPNPAGGLWICQRSLQRLITRKSKERL